MKDKPEITENVYYRGWVRMEWKSGDGVGLPWTTFSRVLPFEPCQILQIQTRK